jgi:hypothetical protein
MFEMAPAGYQDPACCSHSASLALLEVFEQGMRAARKLQLWPCHPTAAVECQNPCLLWKVKLPDSQEPLPQLLRKLALLLTNYLGSI